jgi:signal peptidase I
MTAVLAKGKPFRFQANGKSMSPFIHDGDTIIITPVSDKIKFGNVIAVFNINKHLYVHRVIDIKGENYLLKGDNAKELDGWVTNNDILGVVASIEYKTGIRHFGLGVERTLIAYLSRKSWLIPTVSSLLRIRNIIFKRQTL